MSAGVATIATSSDVLDAVPGAMDLLSDAERARAARLRRDTDRQGFVAAHVLVRLCAAYLFGPPATTTLVQRCAGCGGPHGPAYLLEHPRAGVSLSHAAGVVAAAVAHTAVGVDVEPVARAARVVNLGHRIASPAEALAMAGLADADADTALLMLWVRKEALVKLGLTTVDAMTDLDLSGLPFAVPTGGQHRRLRWDRYGVVDLSLAVPPAVGAVVSESEIEVVPVAQLTA
jgi:4'-phosphopantetheinyl transferase